MAKAIKQPNHLELKQDHECFKSAIEGFKLSAQNIEANTAAAAKTLTELHTDNNEHLKIIAGKKQVPLSIFIIIVAMLSGLIVATEVKYSGVAIDIGWDHIKVNSDKYEKPVRGNTNFSSPEILQDLLKA
jgi:hypothetical protein